MADCVQILLASSDSGEAWSTSAYDPTTGSALWSYRGTELQGYPALHVSCLASQYLMLPVDGKPLLNLVALQARDRQHVRCVLPGQPRAVASTPCGKICCVAIDEKIYTWLTGNGELVGIVPGHYQPITALQFTDDGCCLVSAARDGIVQCWNHISLMSGADDAITEGPTPMHKWAAHSLSVTGLHVSAGGCRGRVLSCSLDQTLKVHSILSGQLLMTVAFDCSVTAVTSDPAECRIFAGTAKSNVHIIPLYQEPLSRERFVSSLSNEVNVEGDLSEVTLSGHGGKVTCLSVSLDACILASGSEDKSVKLWHIESRQCVRTLSLNGAIRSCQFLRPFACLSDNMWKADLPIKPFQKQLTSGRIESVTIKRPVQKEMARKKETLEDLLNGLGDSAGLGVNTTENVASLQEKINQFEKANHDLYWYSVNNVLKLD